MRAEASSRLPRLIRTLPHHATIVLGFLALTALITYPQVRALGTSVPYHSDPYFSMWRLAWVAHTIRTDPRALFEANIFYPAHDTLGYSDAMLLPGAAAAPLFWAGMNPVLIYNLALFGAFALSGYAAFLLARVLTAASPDRSSPASSTPLPHTVSVTTCISSCSVCSGFRSRSCWRIASSPTGVCVTV